MPKIVKINEFGRRIGECHPRAVLTDHEVELLGRLLTLRDELIARLLADGATGGEVNKALTDEGLSYGRLAVKFEVHKTCIQKIAEGERRGQRPAKVKPYP